MKITVQLVQDTLNYLETCPHGQVKALVRQWMEAVGQPDEVKPEETSDGTGT